MRGCAIFIAPALNRSKWIYSVTTHIRFFIPAGDLYALYRRALFSCLQHLCSRKRIRKKPYARSFYKRCRNYNSQHKLLTIVQTTY